MKDNLIFHGIPEKVNKDNTEQEKTTEEILKQFITDTLKIEKNIDFHRVHRMGHKRGQNVTRPIVAKFVQFKAREVVRKAAPTALRGTNFGTMNSSQKN